MLETNFLSNVPVQTDSFAWVPPPLTKQRHAVIISDVHPEPTYAASLTMHRHLVERGGFQITSLPLNADANSVLASIQGRLKNSRLHRYVIDWEFLSNSWINNESGLPDTSELGPNSFVFTLAHGSGCWVAQRFAKKHGLPLVVRFDDWWPDMIQAHAPIRKRVENSYRELYRAADCAICISDGMREALGSHPNAHVIVPIPKVAEAPARKIGHARPLRVCYLGNLYEYGPMLAELENASTNEKDLRFEFRGGSPRWPNELIRKLVGENRLHAFAEGAEFQDWFESFHIYLVAMFFEPEQRRRVETCFATKLTEYSSLGRPIVIWAPESAAIVKWARRTGAAVCVTDSRPQALIDRLRKMAVDPNGLDELSRKARQAYESEFSPSRLQKKFIEAIESVF